MKKQLMILLAALMALGPISVMQAFEVGPDKMEETRVPGFDEPAEPVVVEEDVVVEEPAPAVVAEQPAEESGAPVVFEEYAGPEWAKNNAALDHYLDELKNFIYNTSYSADKGYNILQPALNDAQKDLLTIGLSLRSGKYNLSQAFAKFINDDARRTKIQGSEEVTEASRFPITKMLERFVFNLKNVENGLEKAKQYLAEYTANNITTAKKFTDKSIATSKDLLLALNWMLDFFAGNQLAFTDQKNVGGAVNELNTHTSIIEAIRDQIRDIGEHMNSDVAQSLNLLIEQLRGRIKSIASTYGLSSPSIEPEQPVIIPDVDTTGAALPPSLVQVDDIGEIAAPVEAQAALPVSAISGRPFANLSDDQLRDYVIHNRLKTGEQFQEAARRLGGAEGIRTIRQNYLNKNK